MEPMWEHAQLSDSFEDPSKRSTKTRFKETDPRHVRRTVLRMGGTGSRVRYQSTRAQRTRDAIDASWSSLNKDFVQAAEIIKGEALGFVVTYRRSDRPMVEFRELTTELLRYLWEESNYFERQGSIADFWPIDVSEYRRTPYKLFYSSATKNDLVQRLAVHGAESSGLIVKPTVFTSSTETVSTVSHSPVEGAKHGQTDQYVRLSSLLKKGAIILAVVSAISLVFWSGVNLFILDPFVSLLCLIATPFVYLMGKKVELDSKEPTKNN